MTRGCAGGASPSAPRTAAPSRRPSGSRAPGRRGAHGTAAGSSHIDRVSLGAGSCYIAVASSFLA
ncbi:hypothetical protein ACFPRL_19400 [Pseudoclavibacter helvolus]